MAPVHIYYASEAECPDASCKGFNVISGSSQATACGKNEAFVAKSMTVAAKTTTMIPISGVSTTRQAPMDTTTSTPLSLIDTPKVEFSDEASEVLPLTIRQP